MTSFGLAGRTSRCLCFTFIGMMAIGLLGGLDATGAIHSNGKNNGSGARLPHSDYYDVPAIQWACQPFLEMQLDATNQNAPNPDSMKGKTREFCLNLRGGDIKDRSLTFPESNILDSDGSISKGNAENRNISLDEDGFESHGLDESSNPASVDGLSANIIRGGDQETIIDINGSLANENMQHTPSIQTTEEPSAAPSSNDYTFSLFQEGDGHEEDPDGIPTRYLKMQNERRDLAKTALENTVKWRKENDIDTILARPHPKFDVSKAVFPHYFCGRDDTKHVILLQRPGLLNVKLAEKNGLSGEELLFHYIYVMEYLWRIVDPQPDATMTSIIDLTDLNISILRKREQLRIGSLFLSTMDAHFPQRSYKTFLINAPKWFGALYKLASPLLRESTKEKIMILSKGKEQDEILRDLLRECPIPEGAKYEDVPAGVMEEELRDFCLARLEDAGVQMQSVQSM